MNRIKKLISWLRWLAMCVGLAVLLSFLYDYVTDKINDRGYISNPVTREIYDAPRGADQKI